VKQAVREGEEQLLPKTNKTRNEVQSDSNYGPWMVVTRKKNTARSGRVSGPTKSNQAPQTRIN